MDRQKGRGELGSHKHGVSGKSGPSSSVKRAIAQFFNQERERRDRLRKKRKATMFTSVREALDKFKPSR